MLFLQMSVMLPQHPFGPQASERVGLFHETMYGATLGTENVNFRALNRVDTYSIHRDFVFRKNGLTERHCVTIRDVCQLFPKRQ